jgi:uncharacterized protein
MRAILFFILLIAVYQAVKVVFRSALSAYHGGEQQRAPRIPGEEMVQDPQCSTYVVKGRALARRIGGRTTYFCSAGCADAYEREHRQ